LRFGSFGAVKGSPYQPGLIVTHIRRTIFAYFVHMNVHQRTPVTLTIVLCKLPHLISAEQSLGGNLPYQGLNIKNCVRNGLTKILALVGKFVNKFLLKLDEHRG